MTLSEYRAREGLTLMQLSERIGLPISTLHAYLSGTRKAEPEKCRQISAATGGAVTPADLRPDLVDLFATQPAQVDPTAADAVQHANDQAGLRGESGPATPLRHRRPVVAA
ncbi:helix-turn-helix domain-containing protein [Falsiroseomonas sp.]|uniref:helix-turn-helix domain-containing protein n=1 Tax=Falsiroseomonas sp. TaxID=2870721 RepID=UPI002732CBF2|nr:YdaS family helix-turn-helix protein [Falsiroseomonas sp.]MDP3417880.1 YdaS family helix-turn-helix protein [Falsiroseomonas sp.]